MEIKPNGHKHLQNYNKHWSSKRKNILRSVLCTDLLKIKLSYDCGNRAVDGGLDESTGVKLPPETLCIGIDIELAEAGTFVVEVIGIKTGSARCRDTCGRCSGGCGCRDWFMTRSGRGEGWGWSDGTESATSSLSASASACCLAKLMNTCKISYIQYYSRTRNYKLIIHYIDYKHLHTTVLY